MRALILTAAALVLAGCGSNDQANQAQNVDDILAAQNIVANDITAIDAVTGADANMAADMPVDFTNEVEALEDNAVGNASAPKPARRAAPRPAPARPAPATPAPEANSTVNSE